MRPGGYELLLKITEKLDNGIVPCITSDAFSISTLLVGGPQLRPCVARHRRMIKRASEILRLLYLPTDCRTSFRLSHKVFKQLCSEYFGYCGIYLFQVAWLPELNSRGIPWIFI